MAKETETTVQEKIYNLYIELIQAEKDKKDTMKAHSENVKRIKDELKYIVNDAVDGVTEAQREATD